MNDNILNQLNSEQSFSRKNLFEIYKESGYTLSFASFNKYLNRMILDGKIARIGRNVYRVASEKIQKYSHCYSDYALEIAYNIEKNYPMLDFSLFELIQLNEFTNHQIAHNTLFVNVESDALDFVFETLKTYYTGHVLINPTPEIYHQYWCENLIVVGKLVSESPKGTEKKWRAKLEKILVDIVANPIIAGSVSEGDYPIIFENAFENYIIDESCLFRYAKRRKVDKNIISLLSDKTNIQLRVKGQQDDT